MKYIELLTQKEWHEKCNHILQRDKYVCQDCGCIGFHNDTIYSTESLDEVARFINEEILLGDKFSNLIEQTFSGYTECDKIDIKFYVDSSGNKISANETEREKSLQGYVRWEPYNNVKPLDKKITGKMSVYKIWLYKSSGFYFSNIWELHDSVSIVTDDKSVTSFDFMLHRYNKYVTICDGSEKVTYPMAILKFEKELTNKYYLNIGAESISLSYKNYVFFVSLNPYHFAYKGLNVHHKYYVLGKKPWEYEDNALVTLCESCHQKRHEKPIPKYKSLLDKDLVGYCNPCDRCGGAGYIPQYNHIQHGICFKCRGEGAIVE